jgi:hypothetical protein
MTAKKRLAAYYAIYDQMYENPGIPLYEIAQHTKIPRSTVSRYLAEMYASSVLKGPIICVKPAHNYWNYAHFLTFENPLTVYRRIKGDRRIIMELPDQLLILVNLISPDVIRNLFCTIYDMKTKSIIKTFHQATGLFHWLH